MSHIELGIAAPIVRPANATDQMDVETTRDRKDLVCPDSDLTTHSGRGLRTVSEYERRPIVALSL